MDGYSDIGIGKRTRPTERRSMSEMIEEFNKSRKIRVNGPKISLLPQGESDYIRDYLRDNLDLGDKGVFPNSYIEIVSRYEEGYRFIIHLPGRMHYNCGFVYNDGRIIGCEEDCEL